MAELVTGGAQTLIVGALVSLTVKPVMQVLVLPAASTTYNVTVVMPSPTVSPAAGLCVIWRFAAAVQLSEATTALVNTGTCA